MDRERLLEDLRWLAEGNPRYAGTDEEDRQNQALAHLMADDLLLAYVADEEITTLFDRIRKR
ncbi:MAG TPA: hypothetical protein VKA73_08070 [Rubrobacter sp.]|nr:hypothetical protein [Rubrobacter sp.]